MTSPLLAILQRGVTESTDAMVEAMQAWAGSVTPKYEERLRSLDPQAMVAYLDPARSSAASVSASARSGLIRDFSATVLSLLLLVTTDVVVLLHDASPPLGMNKSDSTAHSLSQDINRC